MSRAKKNIELELAGENLPDADWQEIYTEVDNNDLGVRDYVDEVCSVDPPGDHTPVIDNVIRIFLPKAVELVERVLTRRGWKNLERLAIHAIAIKLLREQADLWLEIFSSDSSED